MVTDYDVGGAECPVEASLTRRIEAHVPWVVDVYDADNGYDDWPRYVG